MTIDEQEFDNYLGEWLRPENLTRVLAAILAYEPKVLVVDVDTSARRFQTLEIPSTKSKIVWARVSHEELASVPGKRDRVFVWRAGAVLGNRPDQPEYVGAPLFPQDPDWTVRSFQRIVTLDARVPTLYWEILKAYCASGSQEACGVVAKGDTTKPIGQEMLRARDFDIDWDFPSVPLTDVMTGGGSINPRPGELGDIVLLGGKFADIHSTPFGPRLGIELTASAVETELANQSEPLHVGGWSQWAVKVLLALGIVWLNSRLMPLWAAFAILLLIILVFVATFVGIYYGLFRMEFLPFMIGIWIEQLIEGAEYAQHAIHSTNA